MISRKYFVLIFSLFILSAMPAFASASVVFTEIMYNPKGTDAGKTWVEIYNDSSAPVSFTKDWRFNDGSSNHTIYDPASASPHSGKGYYGVPANGYTILADNAETFLADHSGFSGNVLDTTFDPNNNGATLNLIDDTGATVATIKFTKDQGAYENDNSLQRKLDGSWIEALPTPGFAALDSVDQNSGGDTSGGGNTSSNTSASSSGPSQKNTVAIQRMEAKLTTTTSVLVDIPVKFSVQVTGFSGEVKQSGVFHFAFGDGTEKDMTVPETIYHTYKYPGSYVVVFEYRSNQYMYDPEISARRTVDVSASKVTIVGANIDGSITIKNSDDTEADLSGWIIRSLSNISAPVFKIPHGTILLPGASVTFASDVTGINREDTSALGLMLPSGVASAVYNPSIEKNIVTKTFSVGSSVDNLISPKAISPVKNSISNPVGFSDNSISSLSKENLVTANEGNVLSAFPESNDAYKPEASSSNSFVWALLGFFGVVSVGTVLLVRNRASLSAAETLKASEDTKAIADSIKIVE